MSASRPTTLRLLASEPGMTLPELTIVLTIVAIGTMLATPVYTDWIARSDLRQGIIELNSTLSFARVAARNRNETIPVSLATVGGGVQISTNGVLPAQILGTHVSGFTGGPVQFSSLGLRVGGGAGDQVLTLTNDRGETYSVRVTPAGKTEWCPRPTCP